MSNTGHGVLLGFLGLPILCCGLSYVVASMPPDFESNEGAATMLFIFAIMVAPVLGAIFGGVIGAARDKPHKSVKTHPSSDLTQESVYTGLNADK
jgi:hypothetical protein